MRYTPFGGYRTGNPSQITDRAYTGQRENMNLGLYYYNARYYAPGIGRFLSADTLVPDPQNPQQFNRYAYSLNSPLNLVDPSGHCTENYADSPELLDQCIFGANSIINKLSEMAYGPGGNGADYNDFVRYLIENATIDEIEGIMKAYEIEYGYTWTPDKPPEYDGGSYNSNYDWTHAGNSICQYWQSCYDPVGDYVIVSGNTPFLLGGAIIWDDWDNVYVNINIATTPGIGAHEGNIKIKDAGVWKNVEDLATDQQEMAAQEFLSGWGDGGCGSKFISGCIAGNQSGNYAILGGIAFPSGGTASLGYTWLIYDKGNSQPWFWQR